MSAASHDMVAFSEQLISQTPSRKHMFFVARLLFEQTHVAQTFHSKQFTVVIVNDV